MRRYPLPPDFTIHPRADKIKQSAVDQQEDSGAILQTESVAHGFNSRSQRRRSFSDAAVEQRIGCKQFASSSFD